MKPFVPINYSVTERKKEVKGVKGARKHAKKVSSDFSYSVAYLILK